MAQAKKKKKKRTISCGKCGGTGHNARSCTQDAEDAAPAPEQSEAEEAEAEKPKPAPKPKPAGKKAKPKPKPKPKKLSKAEKEEAAFFAKLEGSKLGKNSIASARDMRLQIPRMSTGNFLLDLMSFGGLPRGRIVRFTGPPKCGKTGSCLNTVANFHAVHCGECFRLKAECGCKTDIPPMVLWVDAENRMTDMLYWAEGHGVNLDRFKVLCPSTGQHIVDTVDLVLRSPKVAHVGLIVVDSLAHVVSKDELTKLAIDGPTVGRNAALLNSAFRRWVSAVHALGIKNDRKPTILCINQEREKVGVTYGSPITHPGGKGQHFATSLDIRFTSGPETYVVWSKKEEKFVAKQKGYKSSFKPPADATPDFVQIKARVTDSGICPRGREGTFNYWLKQAHGHRPGDPDNPLQLWQYARRYLIEVEGHTKRLAGLEARTYDALEAEFRKLENAHLHAQVWDALMTKLCDPNWSPEDEDDEITAEADILDGVI